MRPLFSNLLLFVFLCYLSSCHNNRDYLKEIDGIIETEPTTALLQLQELRRDNLNLSDYAYYCLLFTQAQIKGGVQVKSDSLIRVARDVLGRNHSDALATRAIFYNGKVAFIRGELSNAMAEAVETYEIAKDKNDHLWIGRAAELTADIYWEVNNLHQAELYTREAAEHYLLASRLTDYRYALIDLATVLQYEGNYPGAINLLDSLYTSLRKEVPLDSAVYSYLLTAYEAVNYNYNLPDSSDKPQVKITSTNSSDEFVDRAIFDSYALSNHNEHSKAKERLEEALALAETDKQRLRIMYAAFKLHMAAGEPLSAAELTDSILRMHTTILNQSIYETVSAVQKDYYRSKAVAHKNRSNQLLWALIGVMSISLVILVMLSIIHKSRTAIRKAELEANLATLMHFKELTRRAKEENVKISSQLAETSKTIENLRQELDQKTVPQENKSDIIEQLFHERWKTLNMLCNEYFEMGGSPNTRGIILNNIEKELRKLKSRKSISELEQTVNTYMNNIMILLRAECTFLKEEDCVFLMLIFAGLSVRAVCLFTDIKYKLYYLKRTRLSKRIAQSDALHKDLFLSKIR